jgi:hypothetical protein
MSERKAYWPFFYRPRFVFLSAFGGCDADHENSLCPKKREGLWITAKVRRRKAADRGEYREAAGAVAQAVALQ